MRFFAFIMAFIVLAMSTVPCADGAVAMSKAKTEIQKTNHQQNDHPTRDCSPFCSCSCCTGSPIPQYVAKLTLVKPELIRNYKSLYSSPIKEISLSIWQPPQLA